MNDHTAGHVNGVGTSRWLQLGAGRMHYIDAGQGEETLVLVHGTPTSSFDWRHVVNALASGHRVIAPDHLGFGHSDRPRDGAYTPEWHAANFAEFVERLNPGPFTLVVHDYGGPIALGFAERRPDLVRRVVIVNSWMWSFADDRGVRMAARLLGGAFGRLLYRWANFSLRVLLPGAYGDRRKLTRAVHQEYLNRFPDRWSRGAVLWPLARALLGSTEFYETLWQQRASLAGRPMLLIWGMKDPAFRPHHLERWLAAFPNAAVLRLPDSGHWPHEEEPAAVSTALARFLAGARPS